MAARETTGGYTSLLRRLLVAASVALLLISTGAGSAAADAPPGERVVVYYFHGTVRCETCILIESLTDITVRGEFAKELADGTLDWRPLDSQLPENKHFVSEFGLGANEVVVAREKAGRSQSWEKIPGIWELTADPEQLAGRVKAVIDRFLGKKI